MLLEWLLPPVYKVLTHVSNVPAVVQQVVKNSFEAVDDGDLEAVIRKCPALSLLEKEDQIALTSLSRLFRSHPLKVALLKIEAATILPKPDLFAVKTLELEILKAEEQCSELQCKLDAFIEPLSKTVEQKQIEQEIEKLTQEIKKLNSTRESLFSSTKAYPFDKESELMEACERLLKLELLNPYTIQLLHEIPTHALELVEGLEILAKDKIPFSITTGSGFGFQVRRILSVGLGKLGDMFGIASSESKFSNLIKAYKKETYGLIKDRPSVFTTESTPEVVPLDNYEPEENVSALESVIRGLLDRDLEHIPSKYPMFCKKLAKKLGLELVTQSDRGVLNTLDLLFWLYTPKKALLEVKKKGILSINGGFPFNGSSHLAHAARRLMDQDFLNLSTIRLLRQFPKHATEFIEELKNLKASNKLPFSISTGSGINFQIRRLFSVGLGRLGNIFGIRSLESEFEQLLMKYEVKTRAYIQNMFESKHAVTVEPVLFVEDDQLEPMVEVESVEIEEAAPSEDIPGSVASIEENQVTPKINAKAPSECDLDEAGDDDDFVSVASSDDDDDDKFFDAVEGEDDQNPALKEPLESEVSLSEVKGNNRILSEEKRAEEASSNTTSRKMGSVSNVINSPSSFYSHLPIPKSISGCVKTTIPRFKF